jgi:hypothetical protein
MIHKKKKIYFLTSRILVFDSERKLSGCVLREHIKRACGDPSEEMVSAVNLGQHQETE